MGNKLFPHTMHITCEYAIASPCIDNTQEPPYTHTHTFIRSHQRKVMGCFAYHADFGTPFISLFISICQIGNAHNSVVPFVHLKRLEHMYCLTVLSVQYVVVVLSTCKRKVCKLCLELSYLHYSANYMRLAWFHTIIWKRLVAIRTTDASFETIPMLATMRKCGPHAHCRACHAPFTLPAPASHTSTTFFPQNKIVLHQYITQWQPLFN